ncbi:hypothetical protein AVEN_480-1 [Araneus ventricosus]|uniref:Uncharacterized protein n=1 Tax=Araneus ventricosus TaxID=182803 RepID=A0A4Y2ESA0_ARAVE|nr:hypothetical protein AVEN_480-1 [Araneus ventricosus]
MPTSSGLRPLGSSGSMLELHQLESSKSPDSRTSRAQNPLPPIGAQGSSISAPKCSMIESTPQHLPDCVALVYDDLLKRPDFVLEVMKANDLMDLIRF